MNVPQILDELEKSDHPVARAVHKGGNYKVLIIAFKKGMQLKEHTAKYNATFIVIDGRILFKTADTTVSLNKYNQVEIIAGLPHSFVAEEDSLTLLMQAYDEYMVHTPAPSEKDWDY